MLHFQQILKKDLEGKSLSVLILLFFKFKK